MFYHSKSSFNIIIKNNCLRNKAGKIWGPQILGGSQRFGGPIKVSICGSGCNPARSKMSHAITHTRFLHGHCRRVGTTHIQCHCTHDPNQPWYSQEDRSVKLAGDKPGFHLYDSEKRQSDQQRGWRGYGMDDWVLATETITILGQ